MLSHTNRGRTSRYTHPEQSYFRQAADDVANYIVQAQ